nr:unnamed protein product [Digitaria exilis]
METPRAEREPSPAAAEEASAAESRELAVLREMMLRARREGEEPQVPDEQLRSNEHLRHDEIHVHCEIPDGITVSAELFQGVDDDLKSNDFIKLPCLHYYCRKCMETYSRMHVKEGTVMDLFCPYDKCQGVIPPNLLKRLLGDSDFERWETLILKRTLDSMVDVTYCPRCETACLEDEENNAQCSKCFFSFCTLCRERRHIGDRCMTPEEKLLSLQDRQKMCGSSRGKAGKEIDLFNQLLSIKEVLRDTVQCPHCDIYVSRVSGCDHMYCGNCRNGFCYGCGKPLDNHRILDQQQKSVKQIGVVKKVVRKSSEHYGPRGCKQHTADPQDPHRKTRMAKLIQKSRDDLR